MSESRIRELLEDAAHPVDAPDLADIAWQAARHNRSRLRIGVAVGVVAAAALGTAVGVGPGQHSSSPPAASGPTSSVSRRVEHGVTIQVAPTVPDEARLQPADAGLPARVQLDRNAPWISEKPVDRLLAAFLTTDISSRGPSSTRVLVLIADDYSQRRLDISQLGPSPDAVNGAAPFTAGSLSPDGTALAFGQVGAVSLYSVQSRSWHHYPVPGFGANDAGLLGWNGDGQIRVGPSKELDPSDGSITTTGVGAGPDGTPNLGADEPKAPAGVTISQRWGVPRNWNGSLAQAAFVTSPTVPDDRNPEAIVVVAPIAAVLLIPLGTDSVRYKGCCVVAGWQGGNRVVYESRSGDAAKGQTSRLISWNVMTGEPRLVSTVSAGANQVFVGSYADFYNG